MFEIKDVMTERELKKRMAELFPEGQGRNETIEFLIEEYEVACLKYVDDDDNYSIIYHACGTNGERQNELEDFISGTFGYTEIHSVI